MDIDRRQQGVAGGVWQGHHSQSEPLSHIAVSLVAPAALGSEK